MHYTFQQDAPSNGRAVAEEESGADEDKGAAEDGMQPQVSPKDRD